MRLLPRTLLWRTFLLVALLMMISVVAWFAIFRSYEREPRARQLAQTMVSVANLTRAALVSARPEARRELLRELSDREGIRIYPAEPTDRVEPLPDRFFLHRVEELVREQLGAHTRLTLEREGEHALFVSFRIDDSDDGDYWLALPRERIDRVFPLGWLGWGVAALLLSLLRRLADRVPHHPAAQGPAVGRAKSRRRRDAAAPRRRRPDRTGDRSHRLQPDERRPGADRPGSGADPGRRLARSAYAAHAPAHGHRNVRRRGLREGMTADIEEMDKTIGQFLDFARSEGGEAPQAVDIAALAGRSSPASTGAAASRWMCRPP
jgi:two-component system osmolarity sensor histidine kinase EnvZ